MVVVIRNFANRSKEEVSEIAKKGGEASHTGGFASMDSDKQVCQAPVRYVSKLGSSLIDGWLYRRRLRPWVGRHQADLSSLAVKPRKRQDARADPLPRQAQLGS